MRFTVYCLKSDAFCVLSIIFVCKIVSVCSVDILYLLNFITENIQGTEGGMLVGPVLDGGRWLGSLFNSCFEGGGITPDTRSVGGWLSPSASLGVVEKR